jgi:endopeptidase Clp ATP-binding regulatory subunit ClpX
MATVQQPNNQMEQHISRIVGEADIPSSSADGEKSSFVKIKSQSDNFIRNFHMKPTELIAMLDKRVIKQDEAIRVLATEICGHYNSIRARLEKNEDPMGDVDRIKPNILLIGPTGVGKTYILKLIAKALGVPFVKVDATKYTEAGYVGADVEDIIRDLANCKCAKDSSGNVDIGMAQYGIIFIDEADKLASCGTVTGPDVSRGGVQQALLTLIEEADVTLKTKMDIGEQIKTIKMIQEGKEEPAKDLINTKHILFIFSGAFPNIEAIIRKRVDAKSGIGFGSDLKNTNERMEILSNIQTSDLIKFGFEGEFIGRIPIRVMLEDLNEDDYLSILKMQDSPVIAQFRDVMSSYGIQITFEEKVLQYIAHKASLENTGARGLQSAFSEAMSIFKTYLPDINIRKFEFILPLVDGTFDQREFIRRLETNIDNKVSQMKRELEEKSLRDASVDGYADYVRENYNICLIFESDVIKYMEYHAKIDNITSCEMCKKFFKEFEAAFGQLSGIGRTELIITLEAIDNTISFLEKAFTS